MGRGSAVFPLALALGAGAGCSSNHAVSPWGTRAGPTLAPYFAHPSIETHLESIDEECAALGLELERELRGKLGRGGPVVVRTYRGRALHGEPVHATRAASERGVILAVGPPPVSDGPRHIHDEAFRLVADASLQMEGGALIGLPPLTDLTGDGTPDVVLASGSGRIEIWQLLANGASPYALFGPASDAARASIRCTASGFVDLDGDALPELEAEATLGATDALDLRATTFFGFDNGAYATAALSARSAHAARAGRCRTSLRGPKARASDAATIARAALTCALDMALGGVGRRDVVALLDVELAAAAAARPSWRREEEQAAAAWRAAIVALTQPDSADAHRQR